MTSVEILEMFKQLNEEEGITIILVTHAAEVAAHAKRAIRIRDGLSTVRGRLVILAGCRTGDY